MNMTAVEGSSLTMLTLPNLMPRANYTLHVFAYTESGCLSSPASMDITVLESELLLLLLLLMIFVVHM